VGQSLWRTLGLEQCHQEGGGQLLPERAYAERRTGRRGDDRRELLSFRATIVTSRAQHLDPPGPHLRRIRGAALSQWNARLDDRSERPDLADLAAAADRRRRGVRRVRA